MSIRFGAVAALVLVRFLTFFMYLERRLIGRVKRRNNRRRDFGEHIED